MRWRPSGAERPRPAAGTRAAPAPRCASPSAGASANRFVERLLRARREDEERVQLARRAQVLLRDPLPCAADLHQRRGERARAAGDHRGAAVGGELAVARERPHEEERDDVDDERDEDHDHEARAVVVVVDCRSRRRRRSRTGRSARRSRRRSSASVMTITSRLMTWVSSCAITPSSSAGESRSMIPVVAQTVAFFCERPSAKAFGIGVSATRDLRLGQVGLDAEALDHRVQLGRLLRARPRWAPIAAQRELVGGEELHQQQAAGDDDDDQRRCAPAANSTPTKHDVEERRAGTASAPSGPAGRCPCRTRWVVASHEKCWQARSGLNDLIYRERSTRPLAKPCTVQGSVHSAVRGAVALA